MKVVFTHIFQKRRNFEYWAHKYALAVNVINVFLIHVLFIQNLHIQLLMIFLHVILQFFKFLKRHTYQ